MQGLRHGIQIMDLQKRGHYCEWHLSSYNGDQNVHLYNLPLLYIPVFPAAIIVLRSYTYSFPVISIFCFK